MNNDYKDLFEFPYEVIDGCSYLVSYERYLDSYLSYLKNRGYDTQELIKVNKLGDAIIMALKTTLNGDIGKAYQKFKTGLRELNDSLLACKVKIRRNENLFRLRISNVALNSKYDLFHIPNNKRYLISNQRYSIAGYPCLYLGYHVYNCWNELNRPNLNETWVSSFRIKEDINIVDFGFNLKILDSGSHSDSVVDARLKLYPLILACSFKTQNPDAKFIEEYIIPNMLLQYIKDLSLEEGGINDIMGIQYLTTKSDSYVMEYIEHCLNIVLTPHFNKENEFYDDRLFKKFTISKPFNCHKLANLPKENVVAMGPSNLYLENIDIEYYVLYKYTDYYNIERYISGYPESRRKEDEVAEENNDV